MTKNEYPSMLEEVWKMKESVYNDIKEMSAEDIFSYVNKKSKNFLKKSSPVAKIIMQRKKMP